MLCRSLSAVETRALQWLAWASQISSGGGLPTSLADQESSAVGLAADALAAERPYVVSWHDVYIKVPVTSFATTCPT